MNKLQIKNYKLQDNYGFTLIEALVAIAILFIGVLGPMTAATRGITDGLYAQNQLVATYLAQEGLELARVKVKNNNLSFNPFLAGLDGCQAPIVCAVINTPGTVAAGAPDDFAFTPCDSATGACDVRYNSVSDLYQQSLICGSACVGLPFTRTFQMVSLSAKEALFKIEVLWFDKSVQKKVNLSLYVLDQS